jgi:hypothetical protein
MEPYREALRMLNLAQDLLVAEGDTLVSANLTDPIHLLETAISRARILEAHDRRH